MEQIRAVVIRLPHHEVSEKCCEVLEKSIKDTNSEIDLEYLDASTPETMDKNIQYLQSVVGSLGRGMTVDGKVNYTYPKIHNEKRIDFFTGLELSGYRSADWRKIAATTVSHMRAWALTLNKPQKPIMVLEHDAIFTRQFKWNDEFKREFWSGAISLNDPRGTTRKGRLYHERLAASANLFPGRHAIPPIDEPGSKHPHGLPGNSAYIIKPNMARTLFEIVSEVGIWPNDALMCKQLCSNSLQAYYPYFTRVQGIKSTTTS